MPGFPAVAVGEVDPSFGGHVPEEGRPGRCLLRGVVTLSGSGGVGHAGPPPEARARQQEKSTHEPPNLAVLSPDVHDFSERAVTGRRGIPAPGAVRRETRHPFVAGLISPDGTYRNPVSRPQNIWPAAG